MQSWPWHVPLTNENVPPQILPKSFTEIHQQDTQAQSHDIFDCGNMKHLTSQINMAPGHYTGLPLWVAWPHIRPGYEIYSWHQTGNHQGPSQPKATRYLVNSNG